LRIELPKGKALGAIHNYVSAIRKYYRMKRVYLNTKHVNEYLPEFRKSKKDRDYTYEEIHRLLDIADERMRTIILLLASTRIRIGAIPSLRLRNVEKVSDLDIYKKQFMKTHMMNIQHSAHLNVLRQYTNI
jgi:integrase